MIIGLDVGGTHTDVVLLDIKGLVKKVKIITQHDNLFKTVLSCLEQITENVPTNSISRIVLSTTLTTNSIIQGKITESGLIVMGGPGIDPKLYKLCEHYYVVSGVIDHRGREVEAVNIDEIKQVGRKLKASGIKYLGIAGKFSARNSLHEEQVAEILKKDFTKIFLGHCTSGNLNFHRRISTTFLNAAVYPAHKEFFYAVKKSLKKKGLNIPINILKADGGTMNFESSIDYPGQTIFSGPSASTMGAIAFSKENEDTVVLDIGGTTTDISVLINRVPVFKPVGIKIHKYKTLIRSLLSLSIGQGGDSVVKVENRTLFIGPDRLGFSMAYGGDVPTPTDALCVLGDITDGDKKKALQGIELLAEKMNLNVCEMAQLIVKTLCKRILREVDDFVDKINSKPVYTVREVCEGYKIKPVKILVLGGHGLYLTKYLNNFTKNKVESVPKCDVANAIGAAIARTTCDVSVCADTEQGIAAAPEENFKKRVDRSYSADDAVDDAFMLLKKKAVFHGADQKDIKTEIVENNLFNMVRDFYTVGHNIRVKVQIKPGLIHGYEVIAKSLSDN